MRPCPREAKTPTFWHRLRRDWTRSPLCRRERPPAPWRTWRGYSFRLRFDPLRRHCSLQTHLQNQQNYQTNIHMFFLLVFVEVFFTQNVINNCKFDLRLHNLFLLNFRVDVSIFTNNFNQIHLYIKWNLKTSELKWVNPNDI